MTYAEAVKIADVLIRRIPEYERGAGNWALAVLHRAEGVMGAVEGADLELRSWIDENGDQVFRYNEVGGTDNILRSSLAYKEKP